jgi:pimeloyl-ACP methyl ester carboxylesterase
MTSAFDGVGKFARCHGLLEPPRQANLPTLRDNQKWRKRMNEIRIAASAIALLSLALPANAQERGPLTLAQSSYFFVGGKIDTSVEGSPMFDQMYVEYMIPARKTHPFPIVMVHGGSQTGTNFTGTPDGREGWAQYFVRRGYAVYVVDQVARGRSAYWAPSPYGGVTPSRLSFVERRFVVPEQSKQWPQAHLHTQWPGEGKPGDPTFEQFYASQFPSLASFPKQQELNRDALVALLDKIGPAILLTHSQSGSFNWPVADARPSLIKAMVAVEPSGPPVHDVDNTGEPDWFKDAERTKVSGLADVPLAYDPPLKDGEQLAVVRQDKADRPDLVRCWRQQEPARKLPRLANIPIVAITGEASYHASYDHCTVGWLEQAGAHVTFIRLADVGVHGNGHMMMIEKNNAAIASVIAQWLERLRLRERQAGR